MTTIKITLKEIKEHLDHKIEIDYGQTNKYLEYDIWCLQCMKVIGNSITEKRN